jgi:hypothetical protein
MEGACMTGQQPLVGKCKTIVGLLTIRGRRGTEVANLIAQANDIANTSNGPGEMQNRIVHDPWYLYTDEGAVAQFKAMAPKDKELKFGSHPVDLKDLENAIAAIQKLAGKVDRLKQRVDELLQQPSW